MSKVLLISLTGVVIMACSGNEPSVSAPCYIPKLPQEWNEKTSIDWANKVLLLNVVKGK